MPTDVEITFAEHAGRFYARRYSFPPVVGRVLGYLAIRHPDAHSIDELSEALLASRTAISNAVKWLETNGAIRRSRAAGERMDRVSLDWSLQAMGFDPSEYEEQGELAREGLALLEDASAERRAFLLEMVAHADFLAERIPVLHQEWLKHRDALRAAGELPDDHDPHTGHPHRDEEA